LFTGKGAPHQGMERKVGPPMQAESRALPCSVPSQPWKRRETRGMELPMVLPALTLLLVLGLAVASPVHGKLLFAKKMYLLSQAC